MQRELPSTVNIDIRPVQKRATSNKGYLRRAERPGKRLEICGKPVPYMTSSVRRSSSSDSRQRPCRQEPLGEQPVHRTVTPQQQFIHNLLTRIIFSGCNNFCITADPHCRV
jgi:hypothetical protein